MPLKKINKINDEAEEKINNNGLSPLNESIGNLLLEQRSTETVVNDAIEKRSFASTQLLMLGKGQLEDINEVSFE